MKNLARVEYIFFEQRFQQFSEENAYVESQKNPQK